ncbi:MAG: hypothetical protein U9Q15_02610 [Patescibacteria group bacterium]|nr:hypothetical protein [Patescibacteria group bacterium]
MSSHHTRTKLFQIFFDFLIINGAIALAYGIRTGFASHASFPFSEYMQTGFLLSFFWILVLFFSRSYKYDQDILTIRHFQRIVYTNLIGIATLLGTYFFLSETFFSRLIILYIFLFSTLGLSASHIAMHMIQKQLYRRGVGTIKTLVIGSNRKAQQIIENLQKKHSRYQVVAVLDGYGAKEKEIAGVSILGKLDKFEQVIHDQKIEHIIQVDNLEQTLNIIHFAEKNDIGYSMIPYLLGAYHENIDVCNIDSIPMIQVANKQRSIFEDMF